MISKRWERLVPWLGLLFLTLPFYRIIYYSDRALYFRDLIRDLLVQKSILMEALRAGEGIPFWNHFALGGAPFLAMNVGSPLNPLNLVFFAFPQSEIGRALAIYLFLHYVIFYWGAYLLLRRLNISMLVATLTASAGAMSGYLVSAHSLGHVLASAAAVPWCFYFLLGYRQNGRKSNFLFACAAIAWPIYGGDPQFTVILAMLSVITLAWQSGKTAGRRLAEICSLALLSLLASAAQLLPTLELALSTARAAQPTAEILQFSFHPLRLLETFYPMFFGNRIGPEEFWAESLVNFPYKNPFIFSTYPGAIIIFGFLFLVSHLKFKSRTLPERTLLASIPLGFFIAFGAFCLIPVYEILLDLLPLFGAFRYPERLLFWPLFATWIFAARSLEEIIRSPRAALTPSFRITLSIFLGLTLAGGAAVYLRWIAIPISALHGITSTFSAIALLWLFLELAKPSIFILVLLLLQPLDLYLNQSALVWDQSKYVADGKRYRLVNSVKSDLERRAEEISHGASFRFSSERLPFYSYSAAQMGHAVFTTFNSLENLAPNTAGLFGIEDISGYFSLISADKIRFSDSAVRGDPKALDLRFYHDLMSVHYLPGRDQNQQIVLRENSSALPYLYVPEKTFAAANFDSALQLLSNENFRSNKDAIVEWHESESTQGFEAGNFLIRKRNGREISFAYFPKVTGSRLVVVNESIDAHWKATVDGKDSEILRINAWAMGLKAEGMSPQTPIEISLKYENPFIPFGFFLTGVWIFFLALQLAREHFPRILRAQEILS